MPSKILSRDLELNGGQILQNGEVIIDSDGNIDAPVTTTSLTLSGSATVGTTLAVTGASTLTGNTSVGGTLGVTGATTLSSSLAVTGTSAHTGAATFAGGINCDGGQVIIDDVTGNSRFRGYLAKKITVAAKTTTTTLTAAEIVGGLITANQGAGAGASYTLPSGTDMDTALPNFAANDSVDFTITNISTVAAEDVTILGGSGTTLLGSGVVASNASAMDKSSGTFRFVKTGVATYNVYRA